MQAILNSELKCKVVAKEPPAIASRYGLNGRRTELTSTAKLIDEGTP
jgi:hypothetical protein